MNPDSRTRRRASRTGTSRPDIRATYAWASRTSSTETSEPLAHSLERADRAARERPRSFARALALAVALHGILLLGVLWLAARRSPPEEPAIPIEFLIEAEPALAPGPIAPSPATPALEQKPPAPPAPSRAVSPRPLAKPRTPPRVEARHPAETAPGPLAVTPVAQPETAESAAGVGGPAPASSRVFGEGEVDAVAAPAGPIAPRYPPREQMLGREAVVVLDVVVEADGRVRDTRVVKSGGGGFDGEARAAVASVPFHAARRQGQSVASHVTVRVHFELD